VSEQFTGVGPYRVTFHQGHAVLVEVWREGARMVFGTAEFPGPCARCGVEILLYEPENTTLEVCQDCQIAIMAEIESEADQA
jgi:hypothetical protein